MHSLFYLTGCRKLCIHEHAATPNESGCSNALCVDQFSEDHSRLNIESAATVKTAAKHRHRQWHRVLRNAPWPRGHHVDRQQFRAGFSDVPTVDYAGPVGSFWTPVDAQPQAWQSCGTLTATAVFATWNEKLRSSDRLLSARSGRSRQTAFDPLQPVRVRLGVAEKRVYRRGLMRWLRPPLVRWTQDCCFKRKRPPNTPCVIKRVPTCAATTR